MWGIRKNKFKRRIFWEENLNMRRSSFIKEENKRPFLYSNEDLIQNNNNILFFRNDIRKFSIKKYYQ